MSPSGSRVAVSLLVCAVCAGCPREPATCQPGGTPTLVIGTGESEFEPIPARDPVLDLVMGPQGGYHTFIGLQATYLDASELVVATMTGTIDDAILSSVDPWLSMACDRDSGTLESAGGLLIWDADPEELDGKTAVVDVSLRDIEGTTVSAQTTFRIDAGLSVR